MMKMTFRWYGESDPVTLEQIRQIPNMSGVVCALYEDPPGSIWRRESIRQLKTAINDAGLAFEVVESVPVSEEIKLGSTLAQKHIDNYCENIKRLGEAGVKCVCYNFMPVFDWLRSELNHVQPDGARALAYDERTVLSMNPLKSDLSLPGWDESYSKSDLQELLCRYTSIDQEELWRNLARFLHCVIPAAESAGIKMAIHPDDPPWGIFGLPRIITNAENIRRLFTLEDSEANALTFCTGSLGAAKENDLIEMAREFAPRIPFAHLRNLLLTGQRSFEEVAHYSGCGSFDMYGIVCALTDGGFDGYVRPDHGRMIWSEHGRYGYGLYDRALGAAYLNGLFEAACYHLKGEKK